MRWSNHTGITVMNVNDLYISGMFALQVCQCNHITGNNWITKQRHYHSGKCSDDDIQTREWLLFVQNFEVSSMNSSYCSEPLSEKQKLNNFISGGMTSHAQLICVQQGLGMTGLTGAVEMDGILCRVNKAIAQVCLRLTCCCWQAETGSASSSA